jgi:hypothetical protein
MPRENPRPFRICGENVGGIVALKAAEGEGDAKKLPSFTGNAYTGAVMKPGGWYGSIVVDLDGIRVPSQSRPVLRQHDHEQIVGHTNSVEVDKKGVQIAGVFSGQQEHVEKVTDPASKGFQWQLSIGANPVRTEYLEAGEETEVNGRTVTGPLTISRETELGEISFVPLGADGDTSATVSASTKGSRVMYKGMLKLAKTSGNVAAAKYSDDDIDAMDEDKAKAALKKCMAGDDDKDEDAKAKAKASDDDKEKDEDKKSESARKEGIKAFRASIADETRRIGLVQAAAKKHGVTQVEIEGSDGKLVKVDLATHGIEAGLTPDQVELIALRASRPTKGVGVPGGLAYSTSTPESSEAVLECAVFQASGSQFQLFDSDFFSKETKERDAIPRSMAAKIKAELNRRYPEKVQEDAHRIFRSRIGLQQLLTQIAAANGYKGREVITDDNLSEVAHACMRGHIQADGSSTISVGNVTSNVQNKFMLQGYLFTELAWMEICARRAVKDFKATKSINLFGDVEFKDLGTSGELDNATLQDQAFANQVKTRGRILTIPRSTIINDDLGAFGQVPMILGRGAGLKLNKVVWVTFMNPGLDDGGSTNFYAATHTLTGGMVGNSNLITGGSSALSSAALNSATILFDNQVDPKGYPLGFDAEVLLYPPDLDTTARELMNSEWIVQSAGATTKQPSNNVWKGRYKPVKSRYLNKTISDNGVTGTGTTTAWWLLANPNILPVIEVAFLNGQEMPTVQTAGPDFQFNIMGITTRAFFDMGVNMQNFRGGVKSNGA